MSEKGAKVRVVQTENGPAVEIAVLGNRPLEEIFTPALAEAGRTIFGNHFGPQGCPTCTSGVDYYVRAYDEVIDVEF